MDRDVLKQEIASVLASEDKYSHKKRQQYLEPFGHDRMKLLWAAPLLILQAFGFNVHSREAIPELPFSHHLQLSPLRQNLLL